MASHLICSSNKNYQISSGLSNRHKDCRPLQKRVEHRWFCGQKPIDRGRYSILICQSFNSHDIYQTPSNFFHSCKITSTNKSLRIGRENVGRKGREALLKTKHLIQFSIILGVCTEQDQPNMSAPEHVLLLSKKCNECGTAKPSEKLARQRSLSVLCGDGQGSVPLTPILNQT